MHQTLLPGTRAPELNVTLVTGKRLSLAASYGARMTLLTFYRGLHCPRCKVHLVDLDAKHARFAARDVRCVAISMNDEKSARQTVDKWALTNLELAFGLTEADARAWGLYLSQSMNEREPGLFNEPALILLRNEDLTIYSALYGTSPFNRVQGADILEGIETVIARDYPPRGTIS